MTPLFVLIAAEIIFSIERNYTVFGSKRVLFQAQAVFQLFYVIDCVTLLSAL